MGHLMPPGERAEFVTPLARRPQEGDPDLVDSEGVGAQRSRGLLGTEDFRPALVAGIECQVRATLGQEPQATGSAASFNVGDQTRPLQVGENLLRPSRAAIREVDRADLGGREDAMLADGGNHPVSRLGEPEAHCRLPTHADPHDRLRAKRCEASAEPVTGCGVGVASTEAITVAEVMESRCGASAEVIAQESSARDAEKIERARRTAPTALML
jgi:hypothetical protein